MKTKAQQLNEGIDHLTDLLADAEESFVKLQLGVHAEVMLNEANTLTFKKVGKVWGLFVLDESGRLKVPLVSGSREVRVLAATKLEALLHALTDEADRQLRAIQEGIVKCEEILAAFKATEPVKGVEPYKT